MLHHNIKCTILKIILLKLFKENRRIMYIFVIFLCSSILKNVRSDEVVVTQVIQTDFNASLINSIPNYKNISENGINLSNDDETLISNNKFETDLFKETTAFEEYLQKMIGNMWNTTKSQSQLPKTNGSTDIIDKGEVSNTFSIETNYLVNSTNVLNHHISSNQSFMQKLENSNEIGGKVANNSVNLEHRSAFSGSQCGSNLVKVLGVQGCLEQDVQDDDEREKDRHNY